MPNDDTITGGTPLGSDVGFFPRAAAHPSALGLTQDEGLWFFDWQPSYILKVVVGQAFPYTSSALVGRTSGAHEATPEPSPLTGRSEEKPHSSEWFSQLEERLRGYLNMAGNWNRYGAPRISPEAVRSAFELALNLDIARSSKPQVIPTQAGGIQFEWHVPGVDLEIELGPKGTISLWYDDEETATERQEQVPSLRQAIPEVNSLLAIVESRTG